MGSGSQINGVLELSGRRNYCDESAMATCVNKGHHSTETNLNSSLRLNLHWKAITATQLASSWPWALIALLSFTQRRNSHSLGPWWPFSQTLKWALQSERRVHFHCAGRRCLRRRHLLWHLHNYTSHSVFVENVHILLDILLLFFWRGYPSYPSTCIHLCLWRDCERKWLLI